MDNSYINLKNLRRKSWRLANIIETRNLLSLFFKSKISTAKNRAYGSLKKYARYAQWTTIFDLFTPKALALLKIAHYISSILGVKMITPKALYAAQYFFEEPVFKNFMQIAEFNVDSFNKLKMYPPLEFSKGSYFLFLQALKVAEFEYKIPVISYEVLIKTLLENMNTFLCLNVQNLSNTDSDQLKRYLQAFSSSPLKEKRRAGMNFVYYIFKALSANTRHHGTPNQKKITQTLLRTNAKVLKNFKENNLIELNSLASEAIGHRKYFSGYRLDGKIK